MLIQQLELAGCILYPIALTLQLPLYCFLLVLEKSEKIREMMLAHGMKLRHYHFTNYLFFYTLYVIIAAAFWIAGIASGNRFFSSTHWTLLLSYFLGWGFCVVSLAHFLSALVNSPRAATVMGYGIALIGSMAALVVALGIYGPFAFSINRIMPVALYIWPQFAFARIMYLMNIACAEQQRCYGPLWTIPFSDEVPLALIFLYICGIVYFVVFLYLDAVLPREYGVPKSPLFLFDCCRKKKKPQLEFVDDEEDDMEGTKLSSS